MGVRQLPLSPNVMVSWGGVAVEVVNQMHDSLLRHVVDRIQRRVGMAARSRTSPRRTGMPPELAAYRLPSGVFGALVSIGGGQRLL